MVKCGRNYAVFQKIYFLYTKTKFKQTFKKYMYSKFVKKEAFPSLLAGRKMVFRLNRKTSNYFLLESGIP